MVNKRKVQLNLKNFWKIFFIHKLYNEKEVREAKKAIDIKTIIKT